MIEAAVAFDCPLKYEFAVILFVAERATLRRRCAPIEIRCHILEHIYLQRHCGSGYDKDNTHALGKQAFSTEKGWLS